MQTINAQQKLIHYWHFNNFIGLAAPGSPSLIVPKKADWSVLDTNKAFISYIPSYKVSAKYLTYWDAVAGDTVNARMSEPAGNALRVRNPSDSMELRFNMPTTGFKNITFKFALQRSGSGQIKELFDYSTDGGTTWATKGLSVGFDSIGSLATYFPIVVGIYNDASVNNNPNFIFRIKFQGNANQANGNNRFDNVTLEGDPSGTPPPPPPAHLLIHYWDFNNYKGLSAAVSPSLIKPINASWSSIDTNKAQILYVPSKIVSAKYLTYMDVIAGEASDTFNWVKGPKGTAAGNNELRVRNPSDSMELRFMLPTTKYKNIVVTYGTVRTTSGPGRQYYDYSTDGGSTWKTLATKSDSILPVFSPVMLDFSGDTTVNNNPSNFIFRVKLGVPNAPTNGNDRFDNITVTGDTDKAGHTSGIEPVNNNITGKVMIYPNPANTFTNIAADFTITNIELTDMVGRVVTAQMPAAKNVKLDLGNLKTGIYFVKAYNGNDFIIKKIVKE